MTDEAKLNNLAAQPDSALRTEFLDQVWWVDGIDTGTDGSIDGLRSTKHEEFQFWGMTIEPVHSGMPFEHWDAVDGATAASAAVSEAEDAVRHGADGAHARDTGPAVL